MFTLSFRSRVTLGDEFGRCVETALTAAGTLVAATWSGDLVDGSSGRCACSVFSTELSAGLFLCSLLAAAAHGGQRVTRLAVGEDG